MWAFFYKNAGKHMLNYTRRKRFSKINKRFVIIANLHLK